MKKISLSFASTLLLFLLVVCWRGCWYCSPERPMDQLKIMTFNIRYGTADDGENSWPQRQTRLIQVLDKYRPDLLGTQEALEFQIEAIASALPQWQVFGLGRYHGIELADRPHESRSGESCQICYDTTKIQLMEHGTFWHSDTPDIPGSMSWGNTLPRITTWGIFQTKISRKQFLVMNTHFHWDEPYVTNASKLILKRWAELSKGRPTILMGDFNLPPNSKTHQMLCGAGDSVSFTGNFFDPWIALGRSEAGAGTFNGFKGDRTGDRIDWILLTPDFKIKNIQIIHDRIHGKYPSDHFPVLARVHLK